VSLSLVKSCGGKGWDKGISGDLSSRVRRVSQRKTAADTDCIIFQLSM